MNKPGKISASLMCSDLLNLQNNIEILERGGINYLHIDIMDGHFVPNLTFGPDLVNSIHNITNIPLDIHLLMERPKVIIRSMNISVGDIVTIHSECSENIMENIAFIKHHGAKFGLALNPDTEIEKVKKYLPYVDVILLMLIVPGFAGSTLIHGIMNKVERTRMFLDNNGYTNIEISVDGSVSWDGAKFMHQKGASIFVGGTKGLFKTDLTLEDSIKNFQQAIQ